MKLLLPLLFLGLVLGSCNKEKRQAKKDKKEIEKYLKDKGLTAQTTASGLFYIIETPGTGTQPTLSSTVTVKYKGYLTSGYVFDESVSTGATFPLENVILGWQEGIPLFKEGGKGKLFIPSALGYGSTAKPTIPANSVLIFDVELLDVQ
jgi:FKBP-type peptidyl-prolyl cis-trans isomerase FkpA